MDGSTADHSDSDSGESWTLLENHPSYGDDAPDLAENTSAPFERGHSDSQLEKDEDTDGISIISDSDPESGPCDISCEKCLSSENCLPKQQDNPFPCPKTPNKKTIESICNEDDFLGDGTHKLKTYVHRRNKRLSMVLNIIMLGSVITAAGVAIGHMWGAKNECATPIPSVNKILSNLYKLQEENAYLRNKLKELTLSGHVQVEQPKPDERKKSVKQHRCKKIFEEPLDVKTDKAFKCVDEDNAESVKITGPSEILLHEKEFLNDITKLQKVYNQNKSWLDEHIQRRLNHENNLRNKRNTEAPEGHKDQVHSKDINKANEMGPSFKLPNLKEPDEIGHTLNKDFRIPESNNAAKPLNNWNLARQVGRISNVNNFKKNKQNKKQEIKLIETNVPHRGLNLEAQISKNPDQIFKKFESFQPIELNSEGISNEVPLNKEKKISYADSLKTNTENQKILMHTTINESNELPIREVKGYGYKQKHGDVDLMLNLISSSEDEIKKDDRYTGPKIKRDKKKHDRHKIHKKQKRKNKYEQWDMKEGYMKDFDEFSMTSSQANLGNDAVIPDKKYLNQDFEKYLIKLTETDEKKTKKDEDKFKPENKGDKTKKGKNKNKDPEWYDKRYTLRAEARRKLEQELFGESSPNTAAWYFRRMNKREQCRAQKDNSTFKKISKQKMNFKMKH